MIANQTVEEEEESYVPIEELLKIRWANMDPKAPVVRRRKRNSKLADETSVILKTKRSVKSPFTDYVEAPTSRRSFNYNPGPSHLSDSYSSSHVIGLGASLGSQGTGTGGVTRGMGLGSPAYTPFLSSNTTSASVTGSSTAGTTGFMSGSGVEDDVHDDQRNQQPFRQDNMSSINHNHNEAAVAVADSDVNGGNSSSAGGPSSSSSAPSLVDIDASSVFGADMPLPPHSTVSVSAGIGMGGADSVEPSSGMTYLELVLEAVRTLASMGQTSGITKIRQTIIDLHPEVLGDSHVSKPIAKTLLMNSVRAACWEAVTKRILENKYGNSYRIVPSSAAAAAALGGSARAGAGAGGGVGVRQQMLSSDSSGMMISSLGSLSAGAMSGLDGGLGMFGGGLSDDDDGGDSDDDSDTTPRKTYSHVILEALMVILV